jgi:hypothetical protein
MMRQYRPDEACTRELFLPDDVRSFQALPEEERAKIRLLKGHMSFGIHRSLPGPSRYFTMIRDPIDRVVSFYYYIRRRPADRLHDQVMSGDVDLATFVESGMARDHTDNSFVRFISGEPFVPFGEVDRRLLDKAMANIEEHFVLTGSIDHFDETIVMLKREMGWTQAVYYRPQNVTAGRPAVETLDARTRTILERHTELDRELITHCAGLFASKLASMPAGFHSELRRFKRRNAMLAKAYPVLQPIRRLVGSGRRS